MGIILVQFINIMHSCAYLRADIVCPQIGRIVHNVDKMVQAYQWLIKWFKPINALVCRRQCIDRLDCSNPSSMSKFVQNCAKIGLNPCFLCPNLSVLLILNVSNLSVFKYDLLACILPHCYPASPLPNPGNS